MRDVHVGRHRRAVASDGHPRRRFTREDGEAPLRELASLVGKLGVAGVELTGSVERRGWSDKDVDLLVTVDAAEVDARGRAALKSAIEEDGYGYSWLYTGRRDAVALRGAVDRAMSRAGFEFAGSDDDIFQYTDGKVPIDLFYSFKDGAGEAP